MASTVIPVPPDLADSPPRSLEIAIKKTFTVGGREREGIKPFHLDVNFVVPAGITILFGPSGSGKSTILNAIAGLTNPDSGTIRAGEQILFYRGGGISVPTRKRGIGYVVQDLALFPHLSAEGNIGYGLSKLVPAEKRERVEHIVRQFKIEKLRDRKPSEISGGERQRVALARALVINPRALLLDEPLSALDPSTKSGILDDLREWNRIHGIPILYVTHNREEVFALGERVIAIENGKVIASGGALEVLQTPRHEAIADWMGLENVFDGTVVSTHELEGTMTCKIAGSETDLELPLGRVQPGERVRMGIGAGEILIATRRPESISARNVLAGKIVSLSRRDVTVIATVNSGIDFKVHLTLGAERNLKLSPGVDVWLIIKTYSCHLLRGQV